MVDISFLNNSGYGDLSTFVSSVLNLAVAFSSLLAVISVVASGFKFMLSRGDEDKIKDAQRSLVFSVLGLILVFLSPTIIQFVLDKIVGA